MNYEDCQSSNSDKDKKKKKKEGKAKKQKSGKKKGDVEDDDAYDKVWFLTDCTELGNFSIDV